MFQKTKLCAGLMLAFGGGLLMAGSQAVAQQRVEITGSSIKRIAAEGALPVQIITAAQIERSGSTSVADLIQKLPAMQGFQVADIAVGSSVGWSEQSELQQHFHTHGGTFWRDQTPVHTCWSCHSNLAGWFDEVDRHGEAQHRTGGERRVATR